MNRRRGVDVFEVVNRPPRLGYRRRSAKTDTVNAVPQMEIQASDFAKTLGTLGRARKNPTCRNNFPSFEVNERREKRKLPNDPDSRSGNLTCHGMAGRRTKCRRA